jgi:hypothetical protein
MKSSQFTILPFISGLLLFLMMDPYFIWALKSNQFYLVTIPLLLIFWCNIGKMNSKNLLMFSFFAFTLFLAAVCKRSNIFGIMAMTLLAVVPFVPTTFSSSVYKYYKAIYTSIIGISIIVWVLVVIGQSIPYEVINPLNTLKEYNYYAYPFLVVPHSWSFSIASVYGSLRFCGPFDEPGVVGTISLLMLFIDKFNLKDKKNVVLIISGILSFSLFFYVASFFYVFYSIVFNKKKVFGVLIILSVVAFYLTTMENGFLNQMLWSRLKWDEEAQSISGNNRSGEELDDYFESIKGTNIYYFGTPDHKLLEEFSGDASYKNAVLTYGMLSCGLYILFFSLLAFRQIGKRKELLLFILMLLLTLYQRPSFFSIYYIFLFTMFIVSNSQLLGNKLTNNKVVLSKNS